MRTLAVALLAASVLAMVALILGVLPPYTFAEFVPIILGALGVSALLVDDDSRKNNPHA